MVNGQTPPPGFESGHLDLTEVPEGQIWWRMFRSKYPDPLRRGYAPSRFSDPRTHLTPAERFAVVYLGASLTVCFIETILRDIGNGTLGDILIPKRELEDWACARIRITNPLKLVDLRNNGALRMRVPTDVVRASSHDLGRQWSLAFWSHTLDPDGIIYPSRLNGKTNIALYDRTLPKIEAKTSRKLLSYHKELAKLIDTFRLEII